MPSNNLLVISALSVLIYCVAGLILPDPYLSSASSFALMAFGAITLLRYAPVAYDIVINGRRLADDGKEGSHLAVFGTALLAAGAVYVGIFGFVWVLYGQPVSWTGTAVSGFGRALMAAGFWLMYASPEVVKRDMRVPGLTWLAAIVTASMLTGIFLGSQLETQ